MPVCSQYRCHEVVNDDALDHQCFFCNKTFCLDHIDDYSAGNIKNARKRVDDVAKMDLDDDYLSNLTEELDIAEDTYDDEEEIIVFSHIMFPICTCCAERLAEESEIWRVTIEKLT